jgi:hypothetical protein
MIIYNHSTPEKLITKYYSVEQVREYPVCELAKDIPNDLLTTTDYTIVERKDTMNLDLSLAILYNNITDLPSALQFARILIINGPRIDTKTIIFYVDRINNGPFSGQVNEYIRRHFDFARQGRKINNVSRDGVTNSDIYTYDQNFINQLIDSLKDCLYAPCNYFGYNGGMGMLGNPEQIPSLYSLPPGDISLDVGPPGVLSRETYSKLLPSIQTNVLAFNQSLISLGKNILSLFYTDKELTDQEKAFKNGQSAYTLGQSQAVATGSTRPDYTTYSAFQKAKLGIQSTTTNALGDCGRINNFFRYYNPYNPEQNIDNESLYYNPYKLAIPERTNKSLGAEETKVLNHNIPTGEVPVVTPLGNTTNITHTEDGFVALNDVEVKITLYGYLKEFGSSIDDEYVGSPNGETSWDRAYSSLVDKYTWMGATTMGEDNRLIETPDRYKQTVDAGGIKIGTASGSAEYMNFIRTASGPIGFKTSHCAVSPEFASFLNSIGITKGSSFTVLIDSNGINTTVDLIWVDTTARGLSGNRIDIFTPIYLPFLDGKRVVGIKSAGGGSVAEVVEPITPQVPSTNTGVPGNTDFNINRPSDPLNLPQQPGGLGVNPLLPPVPEQADLPDGILDN